LGIPAVIGAERALDLLDDGQSVVLDAGRGVVCQR